MRNVPKIQNGFFIVPLHIQHRQSKAIVANVIYCFLYISFFLLTLFIMLLFAEEMQSRYMSTAMWAFAALALGGIHQMLTINEMWHSNL